MQNEKHTIMCTYSISVDDTILEKVKPALPDDKSVEAWMQSQIDILLLQLAESQTCKAQTEDSIASYSRRIANIRKRLNSKQGLTSHEGRSYSPELDVILSMPKLDEADVPEVVSSLLGAGSPVADQDLNAREAYYQYQMEKHQ